MTSSLDVWPEGCTASGRYTEMGEPLYYDVKPGTGGSLGMGLYEDSVCTIAYAGQITIQDVLESTYGNTDDDGSSGASSIAIGSAEWFSAWNKAMDPFKGCQPCMTYGPSTQGGRRRLNEDQQDNENNGQYQQCQVGMNQCAQFAQNTDMATGTFRDVRMATQQGTITPINSFGLSPSSWSTWWREWGFFTISLIVFVSGLVSFCCLVKVHKKGARSGGEPLLD